MTARRFTDEQRTALALYPTARRSVVALPASNAPGPLQTSPAHNPHREDARHEHHAA